MASTKSTIVKVVKQYAARLIENNIAVQRVILFGSCSKGTAREDSDIDIAVISSEFNGDRYLDRRPIVPLRRGIDTRIEPIPFMPEDFAAGGILIKEMKKTGKIIL